MKTHGVDEAARLRILAGYAVLDTAPDEAFDEIVALASTICETPIALVSLVDETRQWFKARRGVAASETPRDQAFCAHAIAAVGDDLFVVKDARQDARFEANPLVVGDPHIVFYAGAPLVVEGGARLGTLCVIDRKPRTLTPAQRQLLRTLSKVVVRHLRHRRDLAERAAAEARLDDARTELREEHRAGRAIAERANLAMDQFLATVSHELRTPLNAMLGWTRLLQKDQLDEPIRDKALKTIERNALAQAQLIGDLLDVSRIVAGKMRLDLAPVDLPGIVEEALEVVRPAAEAKSIELQTVVDPAVSPVTGDRGRLQQVAWNLLANAVKFTPTGGRVQVRLARIGSFIDLAVDDSGEGIAPDFLEHVFECFRQADGAVSRLHGGLGLGLSIVKTIVELHGGTVRVGSAGLGRGASFVVRLPASSVPQGAPSS